MNSFWKEVVEVEEEDLLLTGEMGFLKEKSMSSKLCIL